MTTVAIIGAGVAGLMAAYRLHAAGAAVTVFEAGSHPGGVMRSERLGAYLVEHGPNSIQARTKLLEDLVAAAFNDALRKVESTSQEKMASVTAGMPLPPGMKLPF